MVEPSPDTCPPIRIHSGLDTLLLIQGSVRADADRIDAVVRFDQAPFTLGVEAMAQLAALHRRRRLDFARHAFLAAINDCRVATTAPLDGRISLEAICRGRSRDSAAYVVRALQGERAVIDGTFIIGTRPYGDGFQEQRLRGHYQDLWNNFRDTFPTG